MIIIWFELINEQNIFRNVLSVKPMTTQKGFRVDDNQSDFIPIIRTNFV